MDRPEDRPESMLRAVEDLGCDFCDDGTCTFCRCEVVPMVTVSDDEPDDLAW